MKEETTRLPLAHRLEGIAESTTLKLNATVQTLKAQGVDIVNLTAGEPDFWVPDAAKEAVFNAVHANRSHYTPVPGILELREAIAQKTNHQQPEIAQQAPWKASHVVVSNGGKQALFNTLMALLNPGDEVLIPSPYWLSYPEMVRLLGGVPRVLSTSFTEGFKITPDQLKKAISPQTKILILNSPSNPTGALYSRQEYEALGEVIASAPQMWIISDEIYDRIILGSIPFCSFLSAAPDLRHRTVTLNSMSKSAAMTGWRIGWSVACEFLTQALITIQGQSTSGINALAQWASLAALRLPESSFEEQVKSFQKRAQLMVSQLQLLSDLKVFIPEGAFYTFVGISKYLRPGEDSIGFAQRLLEEAKVAIVPGTPFGEPEFIRFSFATDEKAIQEGCRRVVQYCRTNPVHPIPRKA